MSSVIDYDGRWSGDVSFACQNLSNNAFKVYVCYYIYEDITGAGYKFSNFEISSFTGLSEEEVEDAINELINANYLKSVEGTEYYDFCAFTWTKHQKDYHRIYCVNLMKTI